MGELIHILVVMYLLGTIPALLVYLLRAPEQKELSRTIRQSVKYMAWRRCLPCFYGPTRYIGISTIVVGVRLFPYVKLGDDVS